MIRHLKPLLLCFVAGCASGPGREDGPLDRLIARSNGYTSFHLQAEISDGRSTVPIEMAYRSPDRALLRYGSVATTLLSGGVSHHVLRGACYAFPYADRVEDLRRRYPGLEIGRAPEAVFSLGDGLRAMLSPGRLGARLGWLEELRSYQAGEGNVYRHGQIEIELREDGFISRTSIGGHGFVLKQVEINAPLPDSLFALPPADGLEDTTSRLGPDLERGLEEVYHRWILETSASDAAIEALVRVDLARLYEPEKLAQIQQESLKKALAAFDALHPNARPEVLKDKLLIERGRALGHVELMEEEIQKRFERLLDLYLRGMVPMPPQKEMLDLARRWQAAVHRQVDEQIRRRFEALFDAAARD